MGTLDLPIMLDREGTLPLTRQVAEQLRDAAAAGTIRVGERLPSTRDLARTLRVSRTVTAAAYEQLHAEGWIATRHGVGTFLAAVPRVSQDPGERDSVLGPDRADGSCHSAGEATGPAPEGRAPVDLRSGSPWAAGLRPDMWRRAWRRAADTAPDGRPVRAGLSAYRTAVAEHLLRHRGLAVHQGSVLATGGTTAAVVELALGVLGPDSTVAVEEPGYPRAVRAFQAAGVRVVPAPVDGDGVVVDAIPDGAEAVYCTPAHQFPLGGRLPAARRVELIEWARRRGAWVVEDDYDGELRYDVAPLPLLAAIGPDVVIHLGTTSKIISPTLGTGWMVAPRAVADRLLAHRASGGFGPAPAGQRVLVAMTELGDLARHLRRVRREFALRRDLVTTVLGGAGLAVRGDLAGAHVVVLLDDVDAERRLVERARGAGVLIDGLERCFSGPPSLAGVTIGYAAPARRPDVQRALLAVADIARGHAMW